MWHCIFKYHFSKPVSIPLDIQMIIWFMICLLYGDNVTSIPYALVVWSFTLCSATFSAILLIFPELIWNGHHFQIYVLNTLHCIVLITMVNGRVFSSSRPQRCWGFSFSFIEVHSNVTLLRNSWIIRGLISHVSCLCLWF